MKNNIIEAQDLPEGEKIYLKKDFLGWRIVHPYKDEQGNKIWVNIILGGWRHFIFIMLLVAIVCGMFLYMQHQTDEYIDKCKLAMEKPVEFCDSLGYYDAKCKAGTRDSKLTNLTFGGLNEIK